MSDIAPALSTRIVIGLSAVIIALREGEGAVLTVRPTDPLTKAPSNLEGLPFGPFDPGDHRTFELVLREFVTRQTRFELGYVEQLYTFGDKGRDAIMADVAADGARVVSVGYLALASAAVNTHAPDTAWSHWSRFFPWEDWRNGRPEIIDRAIVPALEAWAAGQTSKINRLRALFAVDGANWNEERVLDRYELLYEAGLTPEARRDRALALGRRDYPTRVWDPEFGEPMISDHRRILATGIGRLRGKLKYRPVIYELLGESFTLSALQRAVEAIAGLSLHKQNFRRAVERTGLVEGLGRMDADTGGRPAELFRFRRENLASGPAPGLSLPLLKE